MLSDTCDCECVTAGVLCYIKLHKAPRIGAFSAPLVLFAATCSVPRARACRGLLLVSCDCLPRLCGWVRRIASSMISSSLPPSPARLFLAPSVASPWIRAHAAWRHRSLLPERERRWALSIGRKIHLFPHPALPLLLRRTPRHRTTTARCAARPPLYEQTTLGCFAAGDGRVTRCRAQLPHRFSSPPAAVAWFQPYSPSLRWCPSKS